MCRTGLHEAHTDAEGSLTAGIDVNKTFLLDTALTNPREKAAISHQDAN